MFQNIGFTELLIILVIVLLVFGANKLPEIGKAMGKSIREFKSAVSSNEEPAEKKEEPKK